MTNQVEREMVDIIYEIMPNLKKSKRVLKFGYFSIILVTLVGILNFCSGHILLGFLMVVLLPINIISTLKLKKSIKKTMDFAEGLMLKYAPEIELTVEEPIR